MEAARALAAGVPGLHLLGQSADGADGAAVTTWTGVATSDLAVTEFARFAAAVDRLNNHLRTRSFVVGYALTLADLAIHDALKGAWNSSHTQRTPRSPL